MKQKFWFLVSHSFKKKVKNKWFFVANIVLLILLVAVLNIDRIVAYFGGDFDSKKEILVVDETGHQVSDLFLNQIDGMKNLMGTNEDVEVFLKTENVEDLKKEIKGTDQVLVVFQKDDVNYLKVSVISSSFIDSSYYQYLYQILNRVKMDYSLSVSGIDEAVYHSIRSNVSVNRIILDEDATNEKEMTQMIMGTVFPTVILPFFVLVILLIQMIGMEINEEKSSRSMEIIISNVSPKVHFFSKIVAGNAFVFLQALLLILYGILGFGIRMILGGGVAIGHEGIGVYIEGIVGTLSASGIWSQLIYIIPLTLILMFLSFIAYSLVAGILASMTVNMEDFQQIQTPIMFICMIGYYLSIMAGMFQGSVLIRILSYVPFLSSLLSPALLITNQIQLLDVFISIFALILLIWFLIRFGLKIYKVGILNYSTDKMWSKLFHAARKEK